MQTSSLPKRLPVPFAQNGEKQTIPVASQVGISGGRASYNDGFPVLTRTPINGGGIPPFGTDFNGILNEITAAVRWQQSGGGYPYDSDFSTTVSGYPKGALIPNSTNDGFWLNTIDGNTTNPENATSALTGWVPVDSYGSTYITGLSSSSVTLSTLQASKEFIYISGTLTSNINLIVPAWVKSWVFINNCTGSYTVTIKTPSGSGVTTSPYSNNQLQGDGTDIIQGMSQGSLIGAPKVFLASAIYTPSVGTKSIQVLAVGSGGGGAGAPATSSGFMAGGSGGGGGGYAMSRFTSGFSNIQVTIGTPGAAGDASPSNGGDGGASSFGSLISAGGGIGGQRQPAVSSGTLTLQLGASSGVGISGNIINGPGGSGGNLILNNVGNSTSGSGGSSYLSGSSKGVGVNTSGNPGSLGGGGSGAASASSPNLGYSGGQGGRGCVIVWEFS